MVLQCSVAGADCSDMVAKADEPCTEDWKQNTTPLQAAASLSWLPACVNRKLLPFKLHYFLFIAGEAGVAPYIAVVGRRNGIGPATMAVIFTVMPLTAVVFKPVCGFIIDRTRNVTAVILVLQVLCTLFYGVAFFCPSAISDGSTYKGNLSCSLEVFDITGASGSQQCSSSGSDSIYCVLSSNKHVWEGVSARLTTDNKIVLANASEPCRDLLKYNLLPNDSLAVPGEMKCSCDAALYNNPNFWIYTVSAILGFALAAALNNVGDAAVSNALGSDIEVFGRQRLFGTLSYGMTSPLIGYLVDVASSESSVTDYRPCFYVFAGAMLLDMILILAVPRMRVAEVSVNFFNDIGVLLSSPEILLFTLFTFLAGSMMGFLNAFETWFLEDLGTPTYLIGLTKTVQCFGAEPVLFFLSTYILKKIGYFYSYSVAFLLFACKALGYSFLRNVWGSLAVNIVGGAIFPMVYAAMAVFAKKKARPGTAASMVCILGANYDGLGSAAGSLVGGLSIDKIGASQTFRYLGFSSVAAAFLSSACYLLLRCTAAHEYDVTTEKPNSSTPAEN
ncbi:major facilitator superfamily domain-containing protein 6-A-like isoform X1 [Dermacentor variabilis]|uniref:major facilitator superfamily domain-containing protein 6-A-like isoform X1 n=2 Tax=Dermacentor variabilis TaxID=34621 RepID=UPI003F5C892D